MGGWGCGGRSRGGDGGGGWVGLEGRGNFDRNNLLNPSTAPHSWSTLLCTSVCVYYGADILIHIHSSIMNCSCKYILILPNISKIISYRWKQTFCGYDNVRMQCTLYSM